MNEIGIVQVTADGSPSELQRECLLKSVILQNTGSDPNLQLYNSISAKVNNKIRLEVDANIQGKTTQIPLWDLYFPVGVYVGIANGTAFIIYETSNDSLADRETKIVQFNAGTSWDGKQIITGNPGKLKGMIIQGSGNDTQVRLWDADWEKRAEESLSTPRMLDLQIDATYNGYCKPIDLHDAVFEDGIFCSMVNGTVFLIYEQKDLPK